MSFRRPLALLSCLALVLVCAAEASARGGGGGGGGRGFGGGGRGGGIGGGRGGMGGRMGGRMGGMGGGPGGGFGMRGNRGGPGTNGKSAKEWEVLQGIEERKKQIQERRERLMDVDRKLQQEAFLASQRLEVAAGDGAAGSAAR